MARTLCLLSSNAHKLDEMRLVASSFGYELTLCPRASKLEIQADELEEVVLFAAREVREELRGAVVEDSGLFVRGLKGFPGPYSSFVLRTIGNEGVLRLMEGMGDRGASFKSAIAYIDQEGRIKVFTGTVDGQIAHEAAGSAGFGFDPIFKPAGYSRTFAEMGIEEKAWISHRGLATSRLMRWLEVYYSERR